MRINVFTSIAVAVTTVPLVASGAIIVEQDFEDTTVFVDGSVPTWGVNDTAGQWTSGNTGAGITQPTIVSTTAHSGTQSVRLVRGTAGNTTASLSGRNTGDYLSDDFELTAWVYLESAASAGTLVANYTGAINAAGIPILRFGSNGLAGYETVDGTAVGYTPTSVTSLPLNTWVGIGLRVSDLETGKFDVLHNDGVNGWVTAAEDFSYTAGALYDVNRLQFGPGSGAFLIDTVSLASVPVPEPTAAGLVMLVGAACMARRQRAS